MFRKFAGILVTLLVLIFVLPKNISAFTNPHYYYDWNRVDGSVLGHKVYAKRISDEISDDLNTFNYTPDALGNALPGDVLYIVKKAQEGLSLAFEFSKEDKLTKYTQIASERAEEIKDLLAEGKDDKVDSAVEGYQKAAEKVKENLSEDEETLDEVGKENAKQLLLLQDLAVDEMGEVDEALEEALESAEDVEDTVLDNKDTPVVSQEINSRLQALKAQGLITEEEITNILNVEERSQLREKLRDYVNQHLFPEADFVKLNESVQQNYPEKQLELIEVKKFEELKRLETEKPSDEILEELQEFAKTYEPGDIVPANLKKWWVPMVRLEELQNTIRPDLIEDDTFKDNVEYTQKLQELIERIKPTQEDVEYLDALVKRNANILNDPFYARIKALNDKYGTADVAPPAELDCGYSQHWVNIPYMPQGGYCVPDIEYAIDDEEVCPPGYYRSGPEASCVSDNVGSYVKSKADDDCPSGYTWVKDSFGGFCEPEFSSDSGGAYPSPVFSPAYCSPGQIFRDGTCVEYQPAPPEGCPDGQFWNGDACVVKGDEGFSYCTQPTEGCGSGRWNETICNCIYEPTPQPTSDSTTSTTTTDSTTSDSTATTSDSGGDSIPSGSTDCTPQDCPSGSTWDTSSCTCHFPEGSNVVSDEGDNVTCPPPSEGCPPGTTFNQSSCACE